MKKVGLCVCQETKNYGSQLQVLATEVAVQKLGYEYEIIRYKKKYDLKFVIKSIPRLFDPLLMKGKISSYFLNKKIKKYPDIYEKCKERNRIFDKFAERYFTNLSPIYYGYDALKDGTKGYDTFLVGSDQLWLPSGLATGFYNLQFAPDEKLKIAYATSFGVSKIPMHQKNKTAKYLDRFHYLSSREKSGTNIIKQLTGRDVPVVVDPTLLLTPEDWKEIIPFHRVVEEKYIFCYFLGDNSEHRKAAKELQRATNLKIVALPLLDNFVLDDLEFADICLFDAASDDFVNLIRGAEYVLTDSFHGSVFSILNEKLFCTFNRFNNGTGSRNSRIDSLCQQLNLESRRYDGDIFKVQTQIDYNKVNHLREERRKESLQYLTTALKGEITIG